jgi:hypothetical protein
MRLARSAPLNSGVVKEIDGSIDRIVAGLEGVCMTERQEQVRYVMDTLGFIHLHDRAAVTSQMNAGQPSLPLRRQTENSSLMTPPDCRCFVCRPPPISPVRRCTVASCR